MPQETKPINPAIEQRTHRVVLSLVQACAVEIERDLRVSIIALQDQVRKETAGRIAAERLVKRLARELAKYKAR